MLLLHAALLQVPLDSYVLALLLFPEERNIRKSNNNVDFDGYPNSRNKEVGTAVKLPHWSLFSQLLFKKSLVVILMLFEKSIYTLYREGTKM